MPLKVVERIVQRSAVVLAAVFLLAPSLLSAQAATWSFQSELDLFLALKAGAEYQCSDLIGIRGTAGLNVLSPTQVSWTLVGVGHVMPPTSGFQLDVEVGIIQSIFDFLRPYVYTEASMQSTCFYLIPGACISVGFRWPSGHQIALRGGGGVLLGYDVYEWQGPAFQPNIAIEYSWRPVE